MKEISNHFNNIARFYLFTSNPGFYEFKKVEDTALHHFYAQVSARPTVVGTPKVPRICYEVILKPKSIKN